MFTLIGKRQDFNQYNQPYSLYHWQYNQSTVWGFYVYTTTCQLHIYHAAEGQPIHHNKWDIPCEYIEKVDHLAAYEPEILLAQYIVL